MSISKSKNLERKLNNIAQEATKELNTFYPTSVLVTGFDIIFFWLSLIHI